MNVGSSTFLMEDVGPPIQYSNKNKFWNLARIFIAVGAVLLLALALGLGLGLGLSNNSDTPQKPEESGCDVFVSNQTRNGKASWRSTQEWRTNASCPNLGEPVCPDDGAPPLLLLSMDGFRAEYLTRGLTPNLKRLSECGAHAPYMRASYPSSTFPNHYTIVTGLNTESHGIIDNSMYDQEWGELYKLSLPAKFDGKWYGGEPIWLTAKRAGKKTATFFWPGSDADIQGEYPDRCFTYDEAVPFEDRVDQVLSWLGEDVATRPDFISLYFNQPDSAGHNAGPYSDWVNGNLTLMDNMIGDLMDGITELGMEKCINIIILADHGMSEMDCDHVVGLSDYLDLEKYYVYTGQKGRVTSQYIEDSEGNIVTNPNPESPEEILSHLSCTDFNTTKDWYTQFYRKEDLPKRLHYASNHRIEEVVAYVEEEWFIMKNEPTSGCTRGEHGADNIFNSMHALFLAYGPVFQQQLTVDPFDNVQLYNLMAEVLAISPAPNNGTFGALHHLLHNPNSEPTAPPPLGEIINCPFPDDTEAGVRRNQSTCSCTDWKDWTDKTVEDIDQHLNLSPEDTSASLALNAPQGVPEPQDPSVSLCQLVQTDYVTGYSQKHYMPLYSAFTINKQEQGGSVLDGNTRADNISTDDACTRVDVRLDPNMAAQCSDYNNSTLDIGAAYLFPPGFINGTENQLDARLSSNLVPMYHGFRTGMWKELLFLVEEYAEKYGTISVLAGPVFDYNADGRMDTMEEIKIFINGKIPVPTQYYMVVMQTDKDGNLTTMAVILNNKPSLDNCRDRWQFEYLQMNVARLRDIELLTGLGLLSSVLPFSTRSRHLTHLSTGLWARIGWMDGIEEGEECPVMPTEPQCPEGYDQAPLLLISLDGFRPDYLLRNHTPTLRRLHDCGVNAPYMRSQYPTHTFPNHFTMVTGKYPEVHGIIDNSMYDKELKEYFCLGCDTKVEWWQAEPLWNTVINEGKKAMTFFWPGSDVPIGGMTPTEWYPYTGTVPYPLRIAKTLDWLDGSTDVGVADFATLYLSKVDSAGHEGGPFSVQVTEALELVEKSIKDLVDGLYRRRLHHCVNIIITSDHGMSEISCDRSVLTAPNLSDEANDKSYLFPGTAGRMSNTFKSYRDEDGGYVYEHIEPDQQVPAVEIIDNMTCVNENLTAIHKPLLPKRLHYAGNSRIDDIIYKMADRWQVSGFSPWCAIKGQHGFDPMYDTMKATFFAYGPSLQNQTSVEPFENIELYNVMAYLTNVTGIINNGTEGSLNHILQFPPDLPPLDPLGDYVDLMYPETDAEYTDRANLTTVNCTCVGPDENKPIQEYDEVLNITADVKTALEQEHLPYGLPTLTFAELSLGQLHHQDYVSGYWEEARIAAWTGFSLQALQGIQDIPVCRRPDVRLAQENQTVCQEDTEGIQQAFLFPPKWSKTVETAMQSLLLSNTVPMYTGFMQGIWSTLLNYIEEVTKAATSKLHIVMGPVWDYDNDGRRDANVTLDLEDNVQPIPSHYFAILLQCDAPDCVDGSYEPLTFILPHQPNTTACMSSEDYLFEHRARIRDVELLTDLHLFPQNAAAIRSRTFYPEQLW